MSSLWVSLQLSLRFALFFIVNILLLCQVFNSLHDSIVDVYMFPIARASAEVINVSGVQVKLDNSMLTRIFYDLLLNGLSTNVRAFSPH